MAQSLYRACKNISRAKASGTEAVGNYEITFEYYNQQSIDDNVEAIAKGEATGCTFGDSDESKVVLVVGETITIPEGFNLTPAHPKKSLVIFCNTFINNGTVSMVGKGPNVQPHDYLLLNVADNYGSNQNILISDYANNAVPATYRSGGAANGINGNNGTNRQCGSGGTGAQKGVFSFWGNTGASGSGYAFGGGAGSGCAYTRDTEASGINVDTVYPMRGTNARNNGGYDGCGSGGIGNPTGSPTYTNVDPSIFPAVTDFGVGGRVIIFCTDFDNKGTITANGTSNTWPSSFSRNFIIASGGASGGGAVDVFYTRLAERGTITANGGTQVTSAGGCVIIPGGNGGNGSVTLLNWTIDKVVKSERKKFSRDNWTYLFDRYVEKLNESEAL